MLTVDRAARTIYGRAIPWNVVTTLNRQRIALVKDALTWSGEPLSLLLRHDRSLIVGKVISLQSASDGLWVQLLAASGDRGNKALAVTEAGWGLSLGFTTLEAEFRGDVEWTQRGQIDEISLVPKPAFP